ncbi:uncharacterized protein K444DRAFT_641144 [Hyaloscypha bicolor E]|uniref:Uncharacterized protein n=1 Tax=Hyaloscypha bicolor E TaxID=1095630 RepID=A0A2J6TM05_9HELO|nr:uncharacterized protein K444DRAFT_641144 [Hyaloscypha bicolor E]PMD64065.1 hypothetical protein K444DRAFT_641144 [Hyaloscypha bicolor E]
MEVRLEELFGCWREAERADRAAEGLLRLRTALDLEFYDQISAVLREVESTSRLLRDLYDLFPIYRSRVPIILYYLNVVLPSFQRTLKEMKVYLEHENLPPRAQWSLMSDRLNQQGGMTLAARFVMYVELLVQLVRLLSRSPLYDPTSLELLRLRHLRLRSLQHISAPPGPLQPHVAPAHPTEEALERRHWAEKIFDDQPHSTTGLRHRRESQCFGPVMVERRLGIASGSKALFKLPFEKNRVSVTIFLSPDGPDMTRLLCRWIDRYNNPMYSCYGVQELCIRRKGSSLQFRRWSPARAHPTLWLVLFFKTWEITHQSESPRWMNRRSRHRIWLRDIHPYVFCGNYKKRHQLRRDGEFEIYFVNEEAAYAFEEVFRGESETESIVDHDDDDHDNHH